MAGGRAPKQKGNRCEREAVNRAKQLGLDALRAWGSDGRALGKHEEVDIVVDDVCIQVKARKKLPAYLSLGHVDAVLIKQDFGDRMILIPFDEWCVMRKEIKDAKEAKEEG